VGRKFKAMDWKELQDYRIERGKRGHKLPQGWRNVDRLELQSAG